MAVWKRNIRFWSYYFLQTLLMILASGVVALIFSVIKLGNKPFDPDVLEVFLCLTPIYWMFMGGILLIIQISNIYKTAVPLVVSMSGTRREALWSMNLTLAAVSLAATLVTGLVWAMLSGSDVSGFSGGVLQIVPAVLGIYLGECALGMLTGIIYVLCGKIGILFITVACGGFGAAIGISFSNSKIGDSTVTFSELMEMIGHPWFWFVTGLLAFAVMAGVSRLAFRKMEVRA